MNFGFLIADFRLRRKQVDTARQNYLLSSDSAGNPRSKSQIRKVAGLVDVALAFALFAAFAEAQQPAKVAKIGYLGIRSAADQSAGFESFRREIRALGYIERKNLVIEQGSAEGKLDRLPATVDDLVRLRVEVIVTASTPAALAAKNATPNDSHRFYERG